MGFGQHRGPKVTLEGCLRCPPPRVGMKKLGLGIERGPKAKNKVETPIFFEVGQIENIPAMPESIFSPLNWRVFQRDCVTLFFARSKKVLPD